MTPWLNIALASKLCQASRRTELEALLQHRTSTSRKPDVIVATPRRFLSLRKLVKPNDAVDAMLRIMHTCFAQSRELGLDYTLALSDHPTALPSAKLYLSHHTINSPAFEVIASRGTTIRHFKAADLPGYTCLDPMGFAGWSSLADKQAADFDQPDRAKAEIDAFYMQSKAQVSSGAQSKYKQSRIAEDLPPKFVFVALQTIGDMVQRQAYMPMLTMLELVVERFSGTEIQVVIKRHPKCSSTRVTKALKALQNMPGVKITTNSIHNILARAQAIFTVNSGVGGEAIIYDLPLYCFGKADYAAVAHQVRSRDDLYRLTTPIRPACTDMQRRNFLFHYRNIYQIRHNSDLPDRLRQLIAEKAVSR
ncbi:hypothetical protein [Lacimonas salitolerans]|uniref:Capsule polysaccharide biosynthesis protein n=1 Tax=Lacimonas salitolerans TaxID=1323750 RepID=A0ABW4EEH0_9RHOB